MMLPLNTTLVISQDLFILHLKNIHTDCFTLNVIECIAQYCLQIDRSCWRPAEDKLTIQRSSA